MRIREGLSALRLVLMAAFLAIVLAGCTTLNSTGLAGFGTSPNPGPATPDSETLGEGDIVIGVLIDRTPPALTAGAHNGVHLAARLAATNPAASRIKFEVRTVAGEGAAIRRAANALRQSGAQIIIADLDAPGSLAAAGAAVPVLSLATATSSHEGLYWAGFSSLDEAAALARAAQARNIRSLVVAVTPDSQSQALAGAIGTIAPQLGITVSMLPVEDANSVYNYLSIQDTESVADALVFATPAYVAAALIAPVEAAAGSFPVPIIGNAGWALEQDALQALPPGWYPSLPRSGLMNFRERFVAAYGAEPNLRSALAYDLMILAAALPTLIEQSPYDHAILTNEQGFQGFTGPFRFQPSGISAQRAYEIIDIP